VIYLAPWLVFQYSFSDYSDQMVSDYEKQKAASIARVIELWNIIYLLSSDYPTEQGAPALTRARPTFKRAKSKFEEGDFQTQICFRDGKCRRAHTQDSAHHSSDRRAYRSSS